MQAVKEYAVDVPEVSFEEYPRTVSDTVNFLSENVTVAKPDSPEIFVYGKNIPDPQDNEKIWMHYPDSSIAPPQLGPSQASNLPVPLPLTYSPGAVRFLNVFHPFRVEDYGAPFWTSYDPLTGGCFIGNSSYGYYLPPGGKTGIQTSPSRKTVPGQSLIGFNSTTGGIFTQPFRDIEWPRMILSSFLISDQNKVFTIEANPSRLPFNEIEPDQNTIFLQEYDRNKLSDPPTLRASYSPSAYGVPGDALDGLYTNTSLANSGSKGQFSTRSLRQPILDSTRGFVYAPVGFKNRDDGQYLYILKINLSNYSAQLITYNASFFSPFPGAYFGGKLQIGALAAGSAGGLLILLYAGAPGNRIGLYRLNPDGVTGSFLWQYFSTSNPYVPGLSFKYGAVLQSPLVGSLPATNAVYFSLTRSNTYRRESTLVKVNSSGVATRVGGIAGSNTPGFLDPPSSAEGNFGATSDKNFLTTPVLIPFNVDVTSSEAFYFADLTSGRVLFTGGAAGHPTIESGNYEALNVNVPVSIQIQTSGNPATSYSASSLPPGLTVNTSTGLISGTPTVAGVYNTTVEATNASGTCFKGIVMEVQSNISVAYYNLPRARLFDGNSWRSFSSFDRGDVLLVPVSQVVLFPWGESDRSYDLAPYGESVFEVPVLPAPPAGFKYKYYIGNKISRIS